jgi:hypothetical protein
VPFASAKASADRPTLAKASRGDVISRGPISTRARLRCR